MSAAVGTITASVALSLAPQHLSQLANLAVVAGVWILGGAIFITIASLLRIDEVGVGIRLITARFRRSS
jgi:hypothetical protein